MNDLSEFFEINIKKDVKHGDKKVCKQLSLNKRS